MKKSEVLFVDDEVSVLESFKRQLHKSYEIDGFFKYPTNF